MSLPHQPNQTPVPTSEAAAEFERNRELLIAFDKHLAVKAAGYAGVLGTGRLVDRREHPDAIPMKRNAMLDIPDPVRCYRVACRSYRLAWLDKAAGDVECLECGKLQPTAPR